MSAAPLTFLRRYRRPIVAIAFGLVVLQTLVTGLVAAQAVALSANPLVAVICHTASVTDWGDGTVPESGQVPACCIFCTAATPALSPEHGPAVAQFERGRAAGLTTTLRIAIAIDPRAVRAGASQAPPHSSPLKN